MLVIRVQLFAGAVQAMDGKRSVDVQLESGKTPCIELLRESLGQQYPVLADLSARSRFAIGKQFVDEDATIAADDDVVLIPPVSGG